MESVHTKDIEEGKIVLGLLDLTLTGNFDCPVATVGIKSKSFEFSRRIKSDSLYE